MLRYTCPLCGNSLHWDRVEGLICPKCGFIAREAIFSGGLIV